MKYDFLNDRFFVAHVNCDPTSADFVNQAKKRRLLRFAGDYVLIRMKVQNDVSLVRFLLGEIMCPFTVPIFVTISCIVAVQLCIRNE